ncbi:hypothetical protein [Compostimonas suwonensis]|uniref:Uncharacterized protein n=1 Tax=Compostimonas suwonensis TaxID=1048394 RepID=A0A2M9C4D8_9MICO|nr:hypothetical protein [Compostimonas suwonensis]PJJ65400.1 hypothetical protein CLV54_0433 [Compostimonas suwonensis]
MIALLDQPQKQLDVLPLYRPSDSSPYVVVTRKTLQVQTAGLDPKSTRFLTGLAGTDFFVGLAHDDRGIETICLIADSARRADSDSACGGVRAGILPLTVTEEGYDVALVADAYDTTGMEASGWFELHPNLWLDLTSVSAELRGASSER